jgi:hypothetical protein
LSGGIFGQPLSAVGILAAREAATDRVAEEVRRRAGCQNSVIQFDSNNARLCDSRGSIDVLVMTPGPVLTEF